MLLYWQYLFRCLFPSKLFCASPKMFLSYHSSSKSTLDQIQYLLHVDLTFLSWKSCATSVLRFRSWFLHLQHNLEQLHLTTYCNSMFNAQTFSDTQTQYVALFLESTRHCSILVVQAGIFFPPVGIGFLRQSPVIRDLKKNAFIRFLQTKNRCIIFCHSAK